jgi:hypothetical protein
MYSVVAVFLHQMPQLPPENAVAPGGGLQMEDPAAVGLQFGLIFAHLVTEYDVVVFKFLTGIVKGNVTGDFFRTSDSKGSCYDQNFMIIHGNTSGWLLF